MNPSNIIKNIQQRKTYKGLANKPLLETPKDETLIQTLIESAYWAPFHKPCQQDQQDHLTAIMPWRFYVLSAKDCRKLATIIESANLQIGKIQSMLNACDYLIQATWIPNQNQENTFFNPTIENMEHIAATSAAIQNLLLTATALNLNTYWSSGGVLRDPFVFEKLNIPSSQILLGSIFIFPNRPDDEHFRSVGSKLRQKRSDINETYRFVSL